MISLLEFLTQEISIDEISHISRNEFLDLFLLNDWTLILALKQDLEEKKLFSES